MPHLFKRLSMLSEEAKRFWVPTLFSVSVAIICLGLSLIIIMPIECAAGWLDLVAGVVLLVWAVRWSRFV